MKVRIAVLSPVPEGISSALLLAPSLKNNEFIKRDATDVRIFVNGDGQILPAPSLLTNFLGSRLS